MHAASEEEERAFRAEVMSEYCWFEPTVRQSDEGLAWVLRLVGVLVVSVVRRAVRARVGRSILGLEGLVRWEELEDGLKCYSEGYI